MSGGGEDGVYLLEKYISGLEYAKNDHNVKSFVISGPCMPESNRNQLFQKVSRYSHCRIIEFTSNMMDYINAADMTVSMAGYNTVCEVLSLRKKAIVVPRVSSVREQYIRAERMAKLGFFRSISPDGITPQSFFSDVMEELNLENRHALLDRKLDFNGLPQIASNISECFQ